MTRLLLILTLLSGCATYSAQDYALAAAVTAAQAADWQQTREISRHPERWREHNPFLGEHPSVEKVDGYFAGLWAVSMVTHRLLPPDWRDVFAASLVGGHGAVVWMNYRHGIRW